jgi:hypothetical protein
MTFHVIDADNFCSSAEPLRVLDVLWKGRVVGETRRCFDACCRFFPYEARKCIYCVIDGIWTLVETIACQESCGFHVVYRALTGERLHCMKFPAYN